MRASVVPSWDLGDLFSSPRDRRIEHILRESMQAAIRFSKRYHGRVSQLKNERALLKALRAYERILERVAKPGIYASLLHSASSKDARKGAFLQRMRTHEQAVRRYLVFFPLELQALSEKRLRKLVKASQLKNYAYYLETLGTLKKHRLSEPEERLLGDKALTGRTAFVRLYQEKLSQQHFIITKGGRTVRVPQAHTVALLYSANRTERRAASQAYTRGLNEQAHQTTFILNMLLEDKAIDDQYRHFEHPEDSRHCTNQIKRETVNTMVSVVIQNYRLVRQYYGLKRKLLGVGALYDYDRYAPYHAHGRAAPKRFSFTEARAIVLRSLANFYPPLAEIGEDFFRKRWIDAASRDGKRAGAFCSHTTSDHHPYLLMNFQGSLADLFTLAHEMGHGIHACLMREQSYLNMEVPLPLAETASVFAEMVVFDYLRAHLKDKHELLALYCGKIENVLATVFRQVSIYRFEQEVHHLRRAEGELSTERLNKLWLKQQQKMFGGSVKLANGYGSWWSAIPHIFHTPFYVYAYAFGELLSLSLYDRYRKACAENLGLKFCERYVRFLRAGNSESGQRLLQPFGVYLDDRKFWEGGMQMITQLIGDVRKLAKGR